MGISTVLVGSKLCPMLTCDHCGDTVPTCAHGEQGYALVRQGQEGESTPAYVVHAGDCKRVIDMLMASPANAGAGYALVPLGLFTFALAGNLAHLAAPAPGGLHGV